MSNVSRTEIELRGNCSVRSLRDYKLEMGHGKHEMGHWTWVNEDGKLTWAQWRAGAELDTFHLSGTENGFYLFENLD